MMRSGSEQVAKALDLLNQAIARDPRYGPALARAGVCCPRLLVEDRSNEPEADRRKGADFARRALKVAGDDPVFLSSAAMTLGTLGEDIGAMIMLTDRALALNPNCPSGWHQSGNLRLWAGYPEIPIEHLEIAQRLSPRMQLGHWRSLIGVTHFLSRRFDQAVSNLILAIQQDQGGSVPYRYLAPLMPTWAGPMTTKRSSLGSAPSRLGSSRTIHYYVTPNIGSCSCRACAWRQVRRNEPDPPSRRYPGRRRRRVLATNGGRRGRRPRTRPGASQRAS